MARTTVAVAGKRPPLNRERVLRGALDIADSAGIEALTMRSLARELGVKPMALYQHVENKEEILDGVIDVVFREIDLPPADVHWRVALRHRALSARRVLARHPWATPLMESRTTPGPATLRQHDAVIGTLRRAGLSIRMTGHAYSLLDSYVYGFVLQHTSLPFDIPATAPQAAEAFLPGFATEEYPHLAELATEHIFQPGYDYDEEFEFGLDRILDSLERLLADD